MKRSISVGVPLSTQFGGQPLSLDSSVIRSNHEIVEENGTSSFVSTADSGFDSVGTFNGYDEKENENGLIETSNETTSKRKLIIYFIIIATLSLDGIFFLAIIDRNKNILNGTDSIASSSSTMESDRVSLSEAYAEKGSEKSEVQLRFEFITLP